MTTNANSTTITPVPASSVRVCNLAYQAVHGRSPKGRGSWAFTMGGQTFWTKPNQTLIAAKREARAEAGRRGLFSCKVAS